MSGLKEIPENMRTAAQSPLLKILGEMFPEQSVLGEKAVGRLQV